MPSSRKWEPIRARRIVKATDCRKSGCAQSFGCDGWPDRRAALNVIGAGATIYWAQEIRFFWQRMRLVSCRKYSAEVRRANSG